MGHYIPADLAIAKHLGKYRAFTSDKTYSVMTSLNFSKLVAETQMSVIGDHRAAINRTKGVN